LTVNHLLELGHKKIGYFGFRRHKDSYINIRRLDGYKKALADYGITFAENLVKDSGAHPEELVEQDDIVDALKDLLDKGVTGLFAVSDLDAERVMAELKKMGIRIPGDVAIVSCDNIDISEYFTPPLTTVSHTTYLMGKIAGEMLIKKRFSSQIVGEIYN